MFKSRELIGVNRVVFVLMSLFLLLSVMAQSEVAWAGSMAAPGATDCSLVTEVPESECQALVDFYDATDGDDWTNNDGWKQTNTPCSWYGVTCDGGHVSRLDMYGNSLTGSLTDLQLPNLQSLDLGDNQLSGSVPDFTNLPNLQYLCLYYNQLSGSVPDFTNLPDLQDLWLGGNQLSGSVPDFTNLPNLQDLDLYSNQLSGSVPDFTNLPNLQDLYLYSNQLSGAVPDFTNLPNLQGLSLSDNQLSGPVPDFTNLPNLQYLCLGGNQLSGSVPDFPNLSNLRDLYLYSNQLSGSVPDFTNLSNLQYLYLYYNQLSGSVPDFTNLPNLQYLYLGGNQLSGSVPDFTNLSSLQNLDLYGNQLGGSVPDFTNLPNLQYLYLSDNQLSGSIPSAWCSLSLSDSYFGYNKFDIYQTDACVDSLDTDWKDTQTVPPINVQATILSDTEVQVAWDVIPYTADGGYYEVMTATASGGPYTSAGVTASKSDDHLIVSGLTPGTTYYFVVRTFTPAHDNQQSDLISDNSEEVMTSAIVCHISSDGIDVTLDWTGNAAFDHYEVLYSEDTYFQPDDAGVTIETTSSTTWTHVGAAADTDHNYSYLVRGVYTDGAKSGISNRNGEFTFGMTPGG